MQGAMFNSQQHRSHRGNESIDCCNLCESGLSAHAVLMMLCHLSLFQNKIESRSARTPSMSGYADALHLQSPRVVASFSGSLTPSNGLRHDHLYPVPDAEESRTSSAFLMMSPVRHAGDTSVHTVLRAGSRASQRIGGVPRERSDGSLVFFKIWELCTALTAALGHRVDSDGSSSTLAAAGQQHTPQRVMEVPLQLLLLVVRWMRLHLPWDAVLRLARRHGIGGEGLSANGEPLLFSRSAFVRCCEDIVDAHLDADAASSHASGDEDRRSYRRNQFLLSCWDHSHELGDLEAFVLLCFDGGALSVASVFTATVLDVFTVYAERLRRAYEELFRFDACNVSGLMALLQCFSNMDQPPHHQPPTASSFKRFDAARISETFRGWCRATAGDWGDQGDKGGRAMPFNRFCECIAIYAAADAYQNSNSTGGSPKRLSWNAAQVRAATLTLLGDTVGSLLLPQIAWRERLRRACVMLLHEQEDRRKQHRRELECNLRRLYIHASSRGDINGLSQLTVDKCQRLLHDTGIVARHTDRDTLRAITAVFDLYSESQHAPAHVTRSASQFTGRAPPTSRKASLTHDTSCALSFPTFVNIMDHVARVVIGRECDEDALSALAAQILASSAGREAMRSIPIELVDSNIEGEHDHTNTNSNVSLGLNTTSSGGSASPLSQQRASGGDMARVADVFALCCQRLHAIEQTPMHLSNGKPGRTTTVKAPNLKLEPADGGHVGAPTQATIPAVSLLDIVHRSGVVPSMASRADVARGLRSIFMDIAVVSATGGQSGDESLRLDLKQFARFVSMIARLRKLQLPAEQAEQVLLRCMLKWLRSQAVS